VAVGVEGVEEVELGLLLDAVLRPEGLEVDEIEVKVDGDGAVSLSPTGRGRVSESPGWRA